MSTSYNITVENKRGGDSNYAVFMDTPQFSGGYRPWMNVWFTSFVPSSGSFDVQTEPDFYAWTGTVPVNPSPGVVINSGMSLLSRLGTPAEPGSTFDVKMDQNFPTLAEVEAKAPPESFQLNTGSDFREPNYTYLVGLAKVNQRGQVAPVASVAPRNNAQIQVAPRMKFFVAESHQIAGEIVDRDSVARYGEA